MPRSVASGRTSATNRVAVQDIKSSLRFDGSSSKVALTQTSGLPLYSSNTAYTILAWVKPSNTLGAQVNGIYTEGSTAGTSPYFSLTITNTSPKIGYFIRDNSATTLSSYETATRLKLNEWNRVAFVDNNGTVKMYINGVEDANSIAGLMNYTRAGTFTFNTSTWGAAVRNTTGFFLNGSLSNCRLYKTALTLAQTELAFNGGEPDAANRVGKYDFREGAGTTAYDSSGNGNHGTITAGTYTADVPTKKRELVGGNLVKNGDFEYAPPFVAATTAAQRWIDGTAGGSTTNNLFGWALSYTDGSVSAAFDTTVSKSGTGSMRLSTLNSTSALVVSKSLSSGAPTLYEARNILATVSPSTSYTLTAWVKTSNASANSVWADIREFSGGLVVGVTTPTNKLGGTNDWTLVSTTVTTASTTRYISIVLRNTVVGNISDAWFDDITLTPTVNTTRTAV